MQRGRYKGETQGSKSAGEQERENAVECSELWSFHSLHSTHIFERSLEIRLAKSQHTKTKEKTETIFKWDVVRVRV
jgi:hypothetical protein